MDFDTSRLNEEERKKLEELLLKASTPETNDDPLDPDPNPEASGHNPNPGNPGDPEVEVGPRLRPREELQRDFEMMVRAAGRKFISRIRKPKKNPIRAGATDLAESKFASKMRTAIEEERRKKALELRTFEEDWAPEVAKLREEDWVGPTTRKADKWGRRWDDLEDARLYLTTKLDAMPVAEDIDRERKLGAARKCQIVLGKRSKGVSTMVDFGREIDEITRVT